jgi:hypothetical protein
MSLSVHEKEYLAILLAIEQWRSYLQVQEFTIRTYQKSLTHLEGQRLHTEWQQKALTKLMGLSYKIVHKKGINNAAADSLSRMPHSSSELYAVSIGQPSWLADIAQSYVSDPKCQALL